MENHVVSSISVINVATMLIVFHVHCAKCSEWGLCTSVLCVLCVTVRTCMSEKGVCVCLSTLNTSMEVGPLSGRQAETGSIRRGPPDEPHPSVSGLIRPTLASHSLETLPSSLALCQSAVQGAYVCLYITEAQYVFRKACVAPSQRFLIRHKEYVVYLEGSRQEEEMQC